MTEKNVKRERTDFSVFVFFFSLFFLIRREILKTAEVGLRKRSEIPKLLKVSAHVFNIAEHSKER